MNLIQSIDGRIRAVSEAHAPLMEGLRVATLNLLTEYRAEVLKRDAALELALNCIKSWHNAGLGNLPQAEQEAVWALYRESPEMRRIANSETETGASK